MATATQVPMQAIQKRIVVSVPDEMLRDLAAMHAAVGGEGAATLPRYVSELVWKCIAEYRAMRIKPSLVPACFARLGEETRTGTNDDVHKTKIEPQDVQRILYLRFSENVPTPDIAARFGVSLTTVTRICLEYQRREHNPANVRPGPNRRHGDLGEDDD